VSLDVDPVGSRWHIPYSHPARPNPRRLPHPGCVDVPQDWGRRLQTWIRKRGIWTETPLGSRAQAVSVLPSRGSRHANLSLDGAPFAVSAPPLCVACPLDPAQAVLVARHPLTDRFREELSRLTRVPVVPVETDRENSDIWLQDSIEVLVVPEPKGASRNARVALTGLRRRHDQGLECGSLDRRSAIALANAHPETLFLSPGVSRPGRRWIDWYGNLEATPPLPGFPHGRLLIGKQGNLLPAAELQEFLRQQEVQWPPIVADVGMFAIGHVDELVTFFPARTPRGWKCALFSARRGRHLLENWVRSGRGDTTLPFAPARYPTAAKLLKLVENSDAIRTDEARAEASGEALVEAMGLPSDDVLRFPGLLGNGTSLLPNTINGVVLGKEILLPDPGFTPFRTDVESQLRGLGNRLRWVDSHHPFHIRGGEIHCGTQVVRRMHIA